MPRKRELFKNLSKRSQRRRINEDCQNVNESFEKHVLEDSGITLNNYSVSKSNSFNIPPINFETVETLEKSSDEVSNDDVQFLLSIETTSDSEYYSSDSTCSNVL